jgi:hypothetical protein
LNDLGDPGVYDRLYSVGGFSEGTAVLLGGAVGRERPGPVMDKLLIERLSNPLNASYPALPVLPPLSKDELNDALIGSRDEPLGLGTDIHALLEGRMAPKDIPKESVRRVVDCLSVEEKV